MIISVHVPRTGGSSFLHYLRAQMGDKLLEDYSWARTGAKPEDARTYACVHGHFFAGKYRDMADAWYAMWFREPLSRLRSHYAFWQENNFPENSTWSKMHDENWSFEHFSLSKDGSLRNLQSQVLDVLEIDQLGFVGLTEEYARSLRLFARIFGLPENVGPFRVLETKPRVWEPLPPATISAIRRLHAEDLEVYSQARRRFEVLAAAHNV